MKPSSVLRNVLLFGAILVPAPAAHAQTIPVRISGSTTVFTNVYRDLKEAISRDSGEAIDVISNGSRQGLSDLAAGKSDIAMISAPLEELLPRLTEPERKALDPRKVTVSKLAETRLVFIVHESNPVKSLTIAQVSDLFTGVVTNWKDVGGPDLPVEIVSNQFSSGQRAVLEEKVTGGKNVVTTAKLVVNDPLIPGIVRQLKGGFGHSGARNDLRGVAVVKTDREIAQPMSLVTLGKPAGRVARVIAASQKAAAAAR
ncbi:MAG: substrate-binding domain-containing protein [Vicinamibacteria bacterium]|nr:substrate-binding domain-containing protein [Vicinamibacteria bacterium]